MSDPVDHSRYSRQVRFPKIGEAGQAAIRAARISVVGCGGLGTVVVDQLVRAGVGSIRLVDRDFVELSNLQRQMLFDMDDLAAGLPKAEAARRKLARVNPEVDLTAEVSHIQASNARNLLLPADLIIDATDNFEIRYLLNDLAVESGVPWVYGSAVGSYGMACTFLPGRSACLRCLFPEPPPLGSSATCDTAGVIAPILHAIAGIQVADALRYLALGPDAFEPVMRTIDVWTDQYQAIKTGKARNPDCPCCGRREFVSLSAKSGSQATQLCGRDAVQITWREARDVDLAGLAATLGAHGTVTRNDFLLTFQPAAEPGMTLRLFRDGRAIIHGTDDPVRARDLYTRYIG